MLSLAPRVHRSKDRLFDHSFFFIKVRVSTCRISFSVQCSFSDLASSIGLEDLLPEGEAELVALLPQDLGEDRVAAVEDRDPALALLSDLGEDLVPVRPARIRPRLEPCHKIPLFL